MEQLKAVILAAGKGTRMKSDLPKVVHTIEGKCLVDYAIEAAIGAGAEDICLVVGYKYEVVRETILHQEVSFVLQEEQLGTGHAVRCAKDFLGDAGQTMILFGDTPLITAETLKRLKEYHTKNKNTVTVLSAMVEDPTGYGRIIRDADGNFVKSVEHKDASASMTSNPILCLVCSYCFPGFPSPTIKNMYFSISVSFIHSDQSWWGFGLSGQ